ncbi:MAG: sigma-70 family RNA polymerase sigma factor [Sedimentisphaerales bacterium]|nr:sigma-70 family RNA polymerase sigma factor [Sedimentisphaerales bacterium]
MVETEAVLLRRFARSGDAEAFAEIIRRHAGLVYGAALRVLADMDRAADVAQDTFLQLTKDARGVTGSLPGWLHRVATHKAIDQMRRESSRRSREARYAASHSRQIAEWKDVSPYVDEGLNALDPELRDILIAHFLEGRTTRHIAATRGISQATVSRRIDAGVANLRGVLRRRGVIVGAGALSLLLGENAVKAAPATLMSELGKIAMVGGHAVLASTTATAAGTSGLQAVLGGFLASAQAKAIVIASVAVIGAASVVTYRHVTEPSAPPAPPVTPMTPATAAVTSPEVTPQPEPMAATPTAGPVAVAGFQAGSNVPEGQALVERMGSERVGGSANYHAAGVTPPPADDPNDSNDRSDEDEAGDDLKT